MKDWYVNIMYRKDGDLIQEFINFKAKNKTQAASLSKEIAASKNARCVGFYLK